MSKYKYEDFCIDCKNIYTESCEFCEMIHEKFRYMGIGEVLSIKYPSEYRMKIDDISRLIHVKG